MPLIVSLETSTPVCSVALHNNSVLLASRILHQEQAHAAHLAPLLDDVMREAGRRWAEVQAIAVAAGPGSYTGLRIGTSTAKGLCYALRIPLVSVGTLEVMDHQAAVKAAGMQRCAMIDARRMEVYCRLTDAAGGELVPVEARVIEATSFEEALARGPVAFFGNGADKCRTVLTHPQAHFIPDIHPLAPDLGVLATTKFLNGQVEDLERFEPFYLKEFMIQKPAPRA